MGGASGPVTHGSCLCGSVRYSVAGPLRPVWQCHCVRCRKTTGNFMAATAALAADIAVTEKRADDGRALRWHHPADDPSVAYGFCAVCGSSLFWRIVEQPADPPSDEQPSDERWSICAGTLDDAPDLHTEAIWFSDHAAAHTHLDPQATHLPGHRLLTPGRYGRSAGGYGRPMTWDLVLSGIDFGEGPRWHDGRLWFSDFYQHTISSVGDDGERVVEHADVGRPSGLGWLGDGRLLFVEMHSRTVRRVEADGSVAVHADLSAIATGHCNDMVVDATDHVYVGNFGFDMEAGAEFATASLALVRPDGTVEVAATDLAFPNGSVIVDDGATLIVGESFGGQFVAFDIAADRTLTNRRTWAEVAGMAPDGCTIDAAGGIWFSDALGRRVVRVEEGGEITHELPTEDHTFACMLGGADGDRLFVLTCADSHPTKAAGTSTGKLWVTTVDIPRNPTDRP